MKSGHDGVRHSLEGQHIWTTARDTNQDTRNSMLLRWQRVRRRDLNDQWFTEEQRSHDNGDALIATF